MGGEKLFHYKKLIVLSFLLVVSSSVVEARLDKKLTEHCRYYDVDCSVNDKIIYITDEDGRRDIWSMNMDGSNKAKLTDDNDIEEAIQFSSDGTKIFYQKLSSNKDSLWVMNTDGSNVKEIYTTDEFTIMKFAVSPDQQKIAFTVYGGNLCTINTDGTNFQELNIGVKPYLGRDSIAWSPDSSRIVFVNQEQYYICVVGADGTGLVNLISGWSPDWSISDKIIYTHPDYHVFVMNPDGTGNIQLASGHRSSQPRWTRDGSKVIFSSSTIDGIYVYVMNADGSNKKNLGVKLVGYRWNWNYVSSSNSDKVLLCTPENIYKISIDTLEVENLTDNYLPWLCGVNVRTTMYSGNTYVANDSIIYSVFHGNTEELWIMDTEGEQKRKLVSISDGGCDQISLSPEGDRIAYVTYDKSGKRELWVMDTYGEGKKKIANADAYIWIYWSPQGDKIAYTRTYQELELVDYNGNNKAYLVSGPSDNADWVFWSPDGSRIGFTGSVGGAKGLFKINPDGTGLEKLIDLEETYYIGGIPSWSSRDKIAFFGTGVNEGLWSINSDGSGLTMLTSDKTDSIGGYPVWSPRGDRILYQNENGELCVMDEDGNNKNKISTSCLYKGFDWSPDSEEIAFFHQERPKDFGPLSLRVVRADGTDSIALTPYVQWLGGSGSAPKFTENGKKLVYSCLSDLWVTAFSPSSPDLERAKVYPNPFKPNDGNPETGTWEQGIFFDRLTAQATIKVYTITGELVATLEKTMGSGNDRYQGWKAINDKGDKVASGVYVYVITGTNSAGKEVKSKTGKLAIIK